MVTRAEMAKFLHTYALFLFSLPSQAQSLVMQSATSIKGLIRWFSPAVQTNQVNLAEAIHQVLIEHQDLYTHFSQEGLSPTLFARMVANKLDEIQDD